jgi:hypothetical protein
VDGERYMFGVLGGQPRDEKWIQEVATPAAQLMEEAAEHIYNRVFHGVYYGTRKQEQKNREDAKLPRRGTHHADSIGSSMGGGQQFPTAFFNNILKTVVLTGLLAQKPFQCIAGFTNSAYNRTQCLLPCLLTGNRSL